MMTSNTGRIWRAWTLPAAIALLALAACGGGGGAKGTSTFTGAGTGAGTGTGTGAAQSASDLSLILSAASMVNSGSATVTATVTAVDANRNAVSGIPVTIQVDNDATVQVSGNSTAENGTVTGIVSMGANRSNRVILVTATSGGLTRQATIQVTGTKITASAVPAVVEPGTTGKVLYTLADSTSSALANTTIVVTGPSGVQSEGTTNSTGQYEYNYTAPATSGNLDIRASAGGIENTTTVIVQAGPGAVPPVTAGSVRSSSVSANPSILAVNSTGDANRIEVRALFVGDNNRPIKNVRVRFDLDGDANSIGGIYTSTNLQVLSNDNGIAQTSYIAGTRFSPTDGLTLRACWSYDDFPAGTCPSGAASPKAKVTVISDALSVTVGTDNLIVNGDLTYSQRFVVQVNDSSGLAKSDALISPLLDLPSYRKGSWIKPSLTDPWIQVVAEDSCDNEDLNRNGVIEVYSNFDREDANSNGQLDPRKADAVVSVEGSQRTNAQGQVILKVTYPKNVGSWVRYRLTVAANGVAGTEGRASFAGTLGVPISDVKAESEPAFSLSPYGTASGQPLVVISSPDDPGKTATLCSR